MINVYNSRWEALGSANKIKTEQYTTQDTIVSILHDPAIKAEPDTQIIHPHCPQEWKFMRVCDNTFVTIHYVSANNLGPDNKIVQSHSRDDFLGFLRERERERERERGRDNKVVSPHFRDDSLGFGK